MPTCLLKKALPFTLALLAGLGAASLFGFDKPRAYQWQVNWREESRSRSRTWLVIRSMPPTKFAQASEPTCEGCSVRMRVMFGADGVVSGNEFQLGPSSYPLIEEATNAARQIQFTPATRRGRPMPVWADVTYACGAQYTKPHTPEVYGCRLTLDKDSVRTWRGRSWGVINATEFE